MSVVRLLILVAGFAVSSLQASAQEPATARGIGYPTVAAALEALRARSDVKITVQGGWTIVSDPNSNTLWSFTPSGHPAHPAAVKRSTVQKDGSVFIEMSALCQAEKAACDKLIEEFQALNDKIREDMRRRATTGNPPWNPSDQQKSRAVETVSRYLAAIDGGRFREAYDFYSAGFKSMVPIEKFEAMEQNFRSTSGGDPVRTETRITRYKDPQNAPAPGVYAAFNITCKFKNINLCEEIFILHEQANGTFILNRQERNIVDKENEQKIRDLQENRRGT